MSAGFPEKLRLVLKLLSLSSAQLASELGIDKSVVSRWLSGAVSPSQHNLSRLSTLVGQRASGFRMIDWDRDMEGLAELFGAEAPAPGGRKPPAPFSALPLPIWDQLLATAAQRGRAYEGFYRLVRPTDIPAGVIVYEYTYVRMDPEIGLARLTIGTFGFVAEGWLLPLHNQLYVIMADDTTNGLTFGILNGISNAKVDVVDGIMLCTSLDVGRTPMAMPLLCERIGDLSGDRVADDARFAELARALAQPVEGQITDALRRHLFPDAGPAEKARGGDWLMQIPIDRSFARAASLADQLAFGNTHAKAAKAAIEAEEDEAGDESFAAKLRLVLKLLSISSVQLASALEVHKSVISRWLSGGVEPSAHNLTRLTSMVAQRLPGFSMLDWERPLKALAEKFGADPSAFPGLRRAPAEGLPLIIWDQIVSTAQLRGAAYHGFFRTTRPSLTEAGGFIQEYGIIQPHESGLPRFRLASYGSALDGWMLPLHDQVYCITADVTNAVLMFGVFNGVGAPHVDAVDGIVLSPSPDAGRSPTAVPLLSEHIEDLSGDPEKDEARFRELAEMKRFIDEDEVPEVVRRRLCPDVGPKAFAEGGSMVLRMPLVGALARARPHRA